ncbi:MAG: hypothetical protein Q4E21_05435 [Clostridia bacterium]|nr:hypothetical protein [Clostridia bacterium]
MERFFNKFGRSVYLSDGTDWHSPVYRAFLQPLRYKNKMYLEGTYTVLGKDPNGLFLYIGPAKHDITRLQKNGRVTDADGKQYVIQRAEKVCRGDEPFYFWAILKEICEVTAQ